MLLGRPRCFGWALDRPKSPTGKVYRDSGYVKCIFLAKNDEKKSALLLADRLRITYKAY